MDMTPLQDPAYTQMRIWLLTAEIHLRQGNVPEAELCAGEARMLAPLSYHLMHLRQVFHFEVPFPICNPKLLSIFV